MRKLIFILIIFLSGCATTLKDKSKLYFRNPRKYHGVEAPLDLLQRLDKHKASQEILYGKDKTGKILSCTLLRNQLYAAMLTSKDDDIKHAALLLEEAYQSDDDQFIKSCDSIFLESLGKIFLNTQKEFLRIRAYR